MVHRKIKSIVLISAALFMSVAAGDEIPVYAGLGQQGAGTIFNTMFNLC